MSRQKRRLIDRARRTCFSLHWCYLCGGDIKNGEKYYDGGYARRAHEKCVEVNPTGELPHDIWKDPCVMAALRERAAVDIQVIACPKCNEYGYWNEGSHYSCRFCNRSWFVFSENDTRRKNSNCIRIGDDAEPISLADTITDTTEGYDNHTRHAHPTGDVIPGES